MAAEPIELYPVIAQIAAAFAGFGSLATGLGSRRGGDDARVDAFRLGQMLFASLTGTLLGLLPAAFLALSFETRWAVGAPAIAAVIALVIYIPLSLRNARRIRGVAGFSTVAGIANMTSATTALIAFALCAFDVPSGRGADLFLVGMVGLLSSSIVMFSRVIASMLRPHSRGG
jgi:hypothetical protein